jgi:hypothetical protein
MKKLTVITALAAAVLSFSSIACEEEVKVVTAEQQVVEQQEKQPVLVRVRHYISQKGAAIKDRWHSAFDSDDTPEEMLTDEQVEKIIEPVISTGVDVTEGN